MDLIAAEPVVKQPLYVSFDERGRLWVVQYKQYPFPAGLKVVSYDRYIRAKFDKVPPPPPHHFRGDDRITIHEDVKGDGSFSKVSTFVDGLNIATAALPGRGGVWVLNPPYLLFYPDPDRTDKAAEKPEVHLSGFGLEDTHSVASSLTWGPDGWLYGAQGSTCTAKVRVEITGAKTTTDFLGQAIWRVSPRDAPLRVVRRGRRQHLRRRLRRTGAGLFRHQLGEVSRPALRPGRLLRQGLGQAWPAYQSVRDGISSSICPMSATRIVSRTRSSSTAAAPCLACKERSSASTRCSAG